jgi:hypothetical protein
MKPRKDLKIYTLRNSLLYIGLAALMGAVIGAAAGIMDWSTGVVYAIGLPTALIIGLMSIRESLFAPVQRPDRQRHRRHA